MWWCGARAQRQLLPWRRRGGTPADARAACPLPGSATAAAGLRPQIPTQVPLWAAVALKAKAKANILAPPWMETDALEDTLAQERASNEFQPLPFHYIELSAALFKHAPDAFGNSLTRVMDLVESIRRRVRGRGWGWACTVRCQPACCASPVRHARAVRAACGSTRLSAA